MPLQPQLNLDRLQQWITFWRLTGAESLCITAFGFRVRATVHRGSEMLLGFGALLAMCCVWPTCPDVDCWAGQRNHAHCMQASFTPLVSRPAPDPPTVPSPAVPRRHACTCTSPFSWRPWHWLAGT